MAIVLGMCRRGFESSLDTKVELKEEQVTETERKGILKSCWNTLSVIKTENKTVSIFFLPKNEIRFELFQRYKNNVLPSSWYLIDFFFRWPSTFTSQLLLHLLLLPTRQFVRTKFVAKEMLVSVKKRNCVWVSKRQSVWERVFWWGWGCGCVRVCVWEKKWNKKG